MLYDKRETPEVMKKIRDYLDEHPTGKTAEKANKIIQVYMDYPQEFHDLDVYVKGRPPLNEWSIGSEAAFLRAHARITGTIELTEKDWEALYTIRDKNLEVLNPLRYKDLKAPWRFPVRTKTQKQFIDYIYEVYCCK